MSLLEQFEVKLEAVSGEDKPRQGYKPEEFVRLWAKTLGSVVIVLERLKATPALFFSVLHGGDLVFHYGPFFSRRSFNLEPKDWEDIAAELEKRGERPLAALKPSEWGKLIEEVRSKVPESPILPPVAEIGTPVPVTVEDLERHGDDFLLRPVEFEGIIIGRSEIKTVPVAVRVVKKVGKEEREMVKVFDLRAPQEAVKFVTGGGEKLDEARFFILQLQQPMGHSRFTVYVVGREVPKSKSVRVRGVVVSEGRKPPFKVVVLATEVEPLNEVVEKLEVTPELLKAAGFQARDYDELKQIVDATFAPKILGRSFAKLAFALTLFSVENLSIGEEVMDGILRTLFFGDTKTGKSSIAKWVYERLGLGAYTVAETGSRAGLLYTVDTETRTVIWGAITLADREYAVIDGFDKMHPEEWKEFREAVENRKVVVRKKAQADAPFRVRLVFCANAEHPISSYVHPIEALRDIHTLSGRDAGASVTRIDLFVPFSAEDVPPERIVEAVTKTAPLDLNRLRLKLLLAWKVEKAVFSPEAISRLQAVALRLIGKFGNMKPPVVHNGYFRTVAKVAAAFASLLGKYQLTREGLEVRVTEEVIPFVERFFEEYMATLGIPSYVASSQADIVELVEEVEKDGLLAEALKLIYQRMRQGVSVTKTELGAALKIRGHERQQQLVNKLVELRLIITKPRAGIILTTEGRRVAALLLQREENQKGVRGANQPDLGYSPRVEWVDLKVSSSNQAETTQAPVSESEKTNQPTEPDSSGGGISETEPELKKQTIEGESLHHIAQKGEPGSKSEQLNQPIDTGRITPPTLEIAPTHTGRITQVGLICPRTPFFTEGGDEDSRFEPSSFGMCYLQLSRRLKEEPDGLSEEEVIRYAVEQGFSEKLARAVLQFMRERGKVSEPRQGWLVWSS